ncbi:MAG: cation acetate symporter [Gracilimonas sp.]|uniref:sodium:solute symporter family protein n=1 Tax=Gracilimonas sp. TaxID=1974203 RepID=UPI0019AB5413|nr:sodium:solute symporter family protein [Gracilimonas sp.]MBD3615222.1 cation acetate symporter [Gracilimonas sp.]
MDVQVWTYILVGITFALYIGIAIWAKAASTSDFYIAGAHVNPITNGMATAADWMSAASFLSMAGLISFMGYDGSVYLMGWTGGYVLLALLLAPYLRKFGKFTIPDFIGDRYYSNFARTIAVICALIVSFTYVAGQMRGVGLVFSKFLEVNIDIGVLIGMAIVFFYAVLGGMKGITYTQVAQYCVLIFAFMVPAFFISFQLTGNPIPQLGFGSTLTDGSGQYLLEKLDELHTELGFAAYTSGTKSMQDVFFITAALMIGTAGLPHVIVRFFTVPKVKDARISVGYALIFIAILYTTAPSIAAFAKYNLMETVNEEEYTEMPEWFSTWEETGLLTWVDKNEDGIITYAPGSAISGLPDIQRNAEGEIVRGNFGEVKVNNAPAEGPNELYVDRDIMVLANPEIANLPAWVAGLVAAGGLAAALSTAAGLLLVISTAVSHDLIKKQIKTDISDKAELMWARISAAGAVVVAGYFGINPPGFVAEVVAIAFGLAAASFFPAIILGIFYKKMNRQGAIAGMIAGLLFTLGYVVFFKIAFPEVNSPEYWWFGISPEGIGTLGMILNLVVSFAVGMIFPEPPEDVQEMVESIRYPK